MEKAIFYVRAMRGEGTGESYEDIIARYQVKMQMVFAEVFNTVIELDRKMKTVISSIIETEHKTVNKWTV